MRVFGGLSLIDAVECSKHLRCSHRVCVKSCRTAAVCSCVFATFCILQAEDGMDRSSGSQVPRSGLRSELSAAVAFSVLLALKAKAKYIMLEPKIENA